MKKAITALCVTMAAAMALSSPAFAVSIVTGDSFSSSSKNALWETDRYPADEFDSEDGYLYLTLGSKGFTSARPQDQRTSYYALQGSKLPVEKTSSNTWTAMVKVNLDDSWFGSSNQQKRVEFRVDLVDGDGNPYEDSPTLAVVKNSSFPVINYTTSKSSTGWAGVSTYVDGDKDVVTLEIDEGWHNLVIHSNKGVITYYLDEKKMGSFPTTEKDLYPSYMAIGARNYNRWDTLQFDNCYLYDGTVLQRQRTSEQQDNYEEKMEETYERKRNNWEDRYTDYKFYFTDGGDHVIEFNGETEEIEHRKAYSKSKLKSMFDISDSDWDEEEDQFDDLLDAIDDQTPLDRKTRTETKEMPDSYWDY